jgi:hypothetical protein
MRLVYVAGDGPLEGATYTVDTRLPVTEELELPIPNGPTAVYRVGQDYKLWFIHLLPRAS